MGDIALPACCMDWSIFLYVERCQVLWKGNIQHTKSITFSFKFEEKPSLHILSYQCDNFPQVSTKKCVDILSISFTSRKSNVISSLKRNVKSFNLYFLFYSGGVFHCNFPLCCSFYPVHPWCHTPKCQ